MPANIQYNGTDIDLIYETPRLGAAAPDRNYQASGIDISDRFTALSAASIANGNISTRVPATGTLLASGNDLSNTFVGNPGQYAVTLLANPSGAAPLVVGATVFLTHQFTLTFSNAAALTSYFLYGGRIQITAANLGAFTPGSEDFLLQSMLSSMGTLTVYDTGHYRTGAGGTITNAGVGGSNLGTTSVQFYVLTSGSPYSSNSYTVTAVANAAPGAATVITITISLVLAQAGVIADSYNGTRVSTVQQRRYAGVVPPVQAAPVYAQTIFNW